MKNHIAHEVSAAAWDEIHPRTGHVVLRGKITAPSIYSTVPPPCRELPKRFMERLNLDRGIWVKAESALQKHGLAVMVRIARSTPDFLRVVVLDHMGTRCVLTRDCVVKGDIVSDRRGAAKSRKARRKARVIGKRANKAQTPKPPKAKRPPRPRRAPAVKRAPAAVVRIEPVLVPLIRPMDERIREELAYAKHKGVHLGGLADAFARAATRGRALHV